MKSTSWLWRSAGLIGLLSACLFVFGFIYAVADYYGPKLASSTGAPSGPGKEQDARDGGKLQIVALGDSLTRGTGDETGKGYVGNVKEILEKQSEKPVFLLGNFSVNGYRTDQLLKDLETKAGVPDAIAKANVILLTIGANDLFKPGAEEIDPSVVVTRIPDALERLEQILQKLAKLNPNADIVYVGLYNPFADLDDTGQTSLVVQRWNDAAFKVTNRYDHMTLVPTFDLFQRHLQKYLYTDHYHPNKEGYKRIAERIVQTLQ